MGKLINPAPIIKKLAERCLVTKGIECSILGEVIDLLKAAPAADAEKVVHAYWAGNEPGDWHCSRCGEYAADGGYEQTNYCPNCGAKMDGGKNKC